MRRDKQKREDSPYELSKHEKKQQPSTSNLHQNMNFDLSSRAISIEQWKNTPWLFTMKKNTDCLRYISDYTTQLCEDYDKPL